MFTDITLRLKPQQAADRHYWEKAALEKANLDHANDFKITRRSIDARQRQPYVNLTVRIASGEDTKVSSLALKPHYKNVEHSPRHAIIVGAGPAGLFAALKCLELDIKPILLERGADVDERRLKLAELSRTGIVDPDTNYSFGEGGAGAYSDGKLYTRSKKRGNVEEVLSIFCNHGASEDILIDAHPHIGSDRLPLIIKNMRQTIISHGGEVHFNCRVKQIIVDNDTAIGVVTQHGKRFMGPVILATGHSARDVYRFLHKAGIPLEAKGIAIGTRLEHPQHLIDQLQYHSPQGRGKWLPPAEYNYVCQADGRGVYSFCMCPGGIIVPAATAPNQCVVNGMSPSNRGSRWANAGMVVELHPGDFPEFEKYGDLQMMELQEWLERRFFDDKKDAGDRNPLNAPAQRLPDFIAEKASIDLPRTSYAPGIHPARIDKLLPDFISSRLRKGYETFGRRCRGFVSPDAVMIGLESRTSSPVRIPRNPTSLQHASIAGLFPAGEGAGYAGGIVSAAIDGIRCAESLYNYLTSKE